MGSTHNHIGGVVVGTVVQAGHLTTAPPAPGPVPVAAWGPLVAGVHRPVVPASGPVEGEVPPYLPRPFDAELDRHVSSGGFVVLVGSSSSGKTRAAWEAVRRRLSGWTVRLPATAAELTALARSDLPAGTVVWLDDAVRVLDEQASAAVREVVATRSDVVLVATAWHEHWRRSSERPHLGALLGAARRVDVPSRFTADQRARAAAAGDARLREAAERGGDRITQYLAAGPALVERHRDVGPYGRAVLDAVVDIGELLHGLPTVEVPVLRAASALYLDADAWNRQPADWFDHAVAETTELVRGAVSPLGPVRGPTGELVGYRLADYLAERLEAGERPAGLWDVLVEHVDDREQRLTLGFAASQRLLVRHAERFHRPLASAGSSTRANTAAVIQYAEVLARRGESDEAHGLLASVLDSDWRTHDPVANVYQWLDEDAGLRQLRTAAGEGSVIAKAVLVLLLGEEYEHEEATSWAMSLVGQYEDYWFLAADMARAGNTAGAIALLDAHDDHEEREHFALAFAREGDHDRAGEIWRPMLESGHAGGMATYAAWLVDVGRFDEAESWLARLPPDHEHHFIVEEVEERLRHARSGCRGRCSCPTGDRPAIPASDAGRLAAEAEARRLVVTEGRGSEWLWGLLVVQDRPDEAYRVLRHGLNPDGSTASPR